MTPDNRMRKRLSQRDFEESMAKLRAHLTCPICGLPKVHSRLRGYHCHNEMHNEMVRGIGEDFEHKNRSDLRGAGGR